MRLALMVLALWGCKKSTPASAEVLAEPAPVEAVDPVADPVPVPPAPVAPERAALTEEQLTAAARALSVRDPEPDCAAVASAVGADPVATWLAVIDQVSQPPYAPMRAASCLVDGHAEEAHLEISAWMREPATAGLGRLVLAKLDRIPESVAVEVVRAGLSGPLDPEVREAALGSERPGVRKLAE